MRTHFKSISSGLLVGLLWLLSGCGVNDNAQKPTSSVAVDAPVIQKELWGSYQCLHPSYEMHDKSGSAVRINGQTITVPAIKSFVSIDDTGVLWRQESAEGSPARVINYNRSVPTIAERNGETIVIACEFATPDGKSKPTRRFRCDGSNGVIVMLGDRGSADCVLTKE